jgi:adenylate cyclase
MNKFTKEYRDAIKYYSDQLDKLGARVVSENFLTTHLQSELHQKRSGFSALVELDKKTKVTEELDAVILRTTTVFRDALQIDRAIFIYNNVGNKSLYPYFVGYSDDEMEQITFKPSEYNITLKNLSKNILVNSYTETNLFIEKFKKLILCPYFITVPVKNDADLIGIFVFGRLLEMRPYRMPLNDSDMDIIKSAASFVSKHVENTKIIELQKLANERLREEKYILGISHELSSEFNLDILIQKIMTRTTELLGAERSTLFVYDRRSNELYTRFAEGLGDQEIRISIEDGIAGSVFTKGRTENIKDPYLDSRFNSAIDEHTGFVTKNILCMPLKNKDGDIIAVTQVLNKVNGSFTEQDIDRLRAFSSQIAVTLEKATLFDDVLNIKNYNESIITSSSNSIITFDEEKRVVTANKATFNTLNLDPMEIIGKSQMDIFSDSNKWIIRNLDKSEKLNQTIYTVGTELNRGDESLGHVNSTALPLLDVKGDRIGSMLVLEDITTEKRVRNTMSRYMSEEVAEQLLENGVNELGGKRQVISVLFSDIRNFTSTSELLDASELVTFLNEYFSEMVDIILDYNGILDKYIGDALMALFGAPFVGEKDADNCLLAANEMVRKLALLNKRRKVNGNDPIDIGIGINTGDMVLGNIGSSKRLEYTVIGDNVNIASRLEGINKIYGTKILFSGNTFAALKCKSLCREIDFIRVKGKEDPVKIYESIGYKNNDSKGNIEDSIVLFEKGLRNFKYRMWAKAQLDFEKALFINPTDNVCKIYISRCLFYAKNEPAVDWDGVWNIKE